jgi:hypothetical protein
MASEDSDQVLPGLLAIHGLRNVGDLDEPVGLEMPPTLDQLHALRELLEVMALGSQELMLPEERNDRLEELVTPADAVLRHVLSMVVVPGIRINPTHPEELLKPFETAETANALRNNEPMEHLKAGLVAAPVRSVLLPNEAD